MPESIMWTVRELIGSLKTLPTQCYPLLLPTLILITLIVIVVIRWVFSTLIKSQSEAIKIYKDINKDIKGNNQLLEIASKQLLKNTLTTREAFIQYKRAITLFALYSNAHVMLNIYTINKVETFYPTAPKAIDIFEKLTNFEEILKPLISSLDKLLINNQKTMLTNMEIPSELQSFDYNTTNSNINDVIDSMVMYLDKFYKKSS